MTVPATQTSADVKAPPPWTGGRVAIVHDWFQGFHGSERVVDRLVGDVLRDAAVIDVHTFHAARDLLPERLAGRIVSESRLAALPGIRQVGHDPGRWRYLLPYMPRYFRGLRLDGYDLVIASSHACAVNADPPDEVPYLCYCYTPMRYAWLSETDRGRQQGLAGAGLRLASAWLRRRDWSASQRPDRYLAISSAVRDRIARFYGRSSEIVHPPVETSGLGPSSQRDGRFLWINRLIPYKRPDVVVEAFRGLPFRLTMVGIGPMERSLRAQLPENVELLGWVPRERLIELYGQAIGFLHVGEEDFGISMVEALAAGIPVIALGSGGALDIVRDGVDGLLIGEATPTAVRNAVRQLTSRSWDAAQLTAGAARFAPERFADRMRAALSSMMAGHSG